MTRPSCQAWEGSEPQSLRSTWLTRDNGHRVAGLPGSRTPTVARRPPSGDRHEFTVLGANIPAARTSCCTWDNSTRVNGSGGAARRPAVIGPGRAAASLRPTDPRAAIRGTWNPGARTSRPTQSVTAPPSAVTPQRHVPPDVRSACAAVTIGLTPQSPARAGVVVGRWPRSPGCAVPVRIRGHVGDRLADVVSLGGVVRRAAPGVGQEPGDARPRRERAPF
jgi:hypothetical protein